MAGNEKEATKFLVLRKGEISLKYLGVIKSIEVPVRFGEGKIGIASVKDVDRCLSTQNSRKKADIYINHRGVSIKQAGASFLYNRLQRAEIIKIFSHLKFDNPKAILSSLDIEVKNFHLGNLNRRNRPWQDFFRGEDFKALVRFHMLLGSPNLGFSSHPAEFILEAPRNGICDRNINIFTFEEYFEEYKDKFKIAIRRQWVGQSSNSEHKRALGLLKKAENIPWVFDKVAGVPRDGWRSDFPVAQRKTVYFLMLEKER